MPPLPLGSSFGRRLMRASIKRLDREKQYEGARLEKRTGALRVYTPQGVLTGAALLWIHGGGMVIGSAAQDDQFCAETARQLGVVVVSVEYRLAPEFPFPSAADDCYAAWTWLQQAATHLQIDRTRVAVGGQSAGGGLAASLVQRIHDARGIQPIAQWLFSPMLDDRTAARTELDAIKHKIWNNRLNRIGWRAFLGTEPGAASVPEYAVPARRNDLRGLPPTWIGVGDIELFFDEDKTYADRLQSAGADSTLEIVPGAPHGFESIAARTRLAQAYLSHSREWLGEKIAGSPAGGKHENT
ncbi:esterase [Dictyobacter sp. S3.2.2.5]|uniref:Esterase n=2 Tax=Dictyobacter halimunensis TaxID=3026934 RepID=A0ABQ6G181_9CHLR|nr:esterase [Dictyobacter sp. S3.2.2.5]